ncbi:MAG TPA: tail fiber domain-containing protein [Pyrinomonadaceae bacterium]|nr:tail fiber domain-containing protein [Pyrinomonadaceae bacterium]
MKRNIFINLAAIVWFLIFAGAAFAQTTSFVFQGKLNDNGSAANGTYQFQFKLFDATAGGNQVGQTITDVSAVVTDGIFSVNLDFGVTSFEGAARFIEIGVKTNGGQDYTILNPRQPVTSTPYAIRSIHTNLANSALMSTNSAKLGNIPADQYVVTTDARMSDARAPQPGSANYIQNTQNQQTGTANFNISGEGKANILTATTQFNLFNKRILSASNGNMFVGHEAGVENTTGGDNSFFGTFTGQKNMTGILNSFFGYSAGKNNLKGNLNSFFGYNSGLMNTSGIENSFFGHSSGFNNTTGGGNAFFGGNTGKSNSTGSFNAFFGYNAGSSNLAGFNSFFGFNTGLKNTTGTFNAFVGSQAGASNLDGNDNSFIGQFAGFNNKSGSRNTAIGSAAGQKNTTGANNTFIGFNSGFSNTVEDNNTFIGYLSNGVAGITNATAIGANAFVTESNSMVLGTNAVTVKVPGSFNVAGSSVFSGTVAANVFNATSQFNINGFRALSANGLRNIFAGNASGQALTLGFNDAFFGVEAGQSNTTGNNNTFAGFRAGGENTTGYSNTFVGSNTGQANITGNYNTLLGWNANLEASNLTYATAIGAGAVAEESNAIYIGRKNGLDVTVINGFTFVKDDFKAWNIFVNDIRAKDLIVKNITLDRLKFGGMGGNVPICRNGDWMITACTASLQDQENVQTFTRGLELIKKLRPVTFTWKSEKTNDIGFVAEEVAKAEPRLSTYNQKGEIEGVKYAQITTALVNAVKEQQSQIEKQDEQIKRQQAQIEALKALVCAGNPTAAACQPQQ